MFGLLSVDFDQFVDKADKKKYQAHYCGLCHALSKEYGQLYRFATTYETTLMYLFFSGQGMTSPFIQKTFCPVSLLKKNIYSNNADIIAAISILLVYEKMLDDEYDDRRRLPHFIRSRVKSKYDKACYRLENIGFNPLYLKDLMVFQRTLEANKVHSFQKTSEPTALMMAYLFEFLSTLNKKNETTTAISKEIGYQLGKWIYLMDSVLDIPEDNLHNKFNPILLKCGTIRTRNINLLNIPGPIKDEIKENFSNILRQLKASFNLIKTHENYNLIKYISITNLEKKTDAVFQAMAAGNKFNIKRLDFIQASIAGAISSPKLAFASNGLDQACGSCLGPVLMCGIIFYAFKIMFRCNLGHMGCCSPCNMGRPNTIQVEDGCGGKKTLKRGFDGKYRDQNSCC